MVAALIAVAGCLTVTARHAAVPSALAGHADTRPLARLHVSADDITWTTTNRYPDWFRRVYRYKELVGSLSSWQSTAGAWRGIPHREIRMGTLHLDPGGVYPAHAHPAPELYYVVSGRARWTVGGETFDVRPGSAVHTPPDVEHRIVNTGEATLELLYVWWAPGGDASALDVPSRMTSGWDTPQP